MSTEIAPTPAQIEQRQIGYANFIATKVVEQAVTTVPQEEWSRLFLTAFRKTPKLFDADRASVIAALTSCAQLDLRPNTPMGHAYLIPFKGECTLILGYKGFLELAHRTGKIRALYAEVVFTDEEFEISGGSDGQTIRHKLNPARSTVIDDASAAKAAIVGAYAVCKTTDGGTFSRWVSAADIESRRLRGGSAKARVSPWHTDYLAMARKTAVRALFGSGEAPMSDKIAAALELEDHQERDAVAEERKATGPGVASVGYDTLPGAVQIEAAPAFDPSTLHPDFQRLLKRLEGAGWLDDAIKDVGRPVAEWGEAEFFAARDFGARRKAEAEAAAAKSVAETAAFGESGGEE